MENVHKINRCTVCVCVALAIVFLTYVLQVARLCL
jgi:hypothetical protein